MGKKREGKFILTSGDQIEKINQAFKRLGLDASASSFEFLAQKNIEEHGTIYDFLENLLKGEYVDKEQRRVAREIKNAKLYPITNLKDYNFSEQPSVDPVQINEFASCRFIEKGRNIIFLGAPGVGKTHLSVALGLIAIEKGFVVRFMRLNEFIDAVDRSKDTGTRRLQSSLTGANLLILDDIDYYTPDEDAGKFLFDVLKQRDLDNRSIIITSNKSPDDWGNLFGDASRRVAAVDRIFNKYKSDVINFKGGSSHRVPNPSYQTIAKPKSELAALKR